jgi:hypothetical protein
MQDVVEALARPRLHVMHDQDEARGVSRRIHPMKVWRSRRRTCRARIFHGQETAVCHRCAHYGEGRRLLLSAAWPAGTRATGARATGKLSAGRRLSGASAGGGGILLRESSGNTG